jgi:hypothetical protein
LGDSHHRRQGSCEKCSRAFLTGMGWSPWTPCMNSCQRWCIGSLYGWTQMERFLNVLTITWQCYCRSVTDTSMLNNMVCKFQWRLVVSIMKNGKWHVYTIIYEVSSPMTITMNFWRFETRTIVIPLYQWFYIYFKEGCVLQTENPLKGKTLFISSASPSSFFPTLMQRINSRWILVLSGL